MWTTSAKNEQLPFSNMAPTVPSYQHRAVRDFDAGEPVTVGTMLVLRIRQHFHRSLVSIPLRRRMVSQRWFIGQNRLDLASRYGDSSLIWVVGVIVNKVKSMQTNIVKTKCRMCEGTGKLTSVEFETDKPVEVKCGICRGRGYFEVERA